MNHLYYGDNLEVMRDSIGDESVDLVYLDPPFNSSRAYNVIFARHAHSGNGASAQIQAFGDTWHWTPATDQQYQLRAAEERVGRAPAARPPTAPRPAAHRPDDHGPARVRARRHPGVRHPASQPAAGGLTTMPGTRNDRNTDTVGHSHHLRAA
jgi:hypothetical protein